MKMFLGNTPVNSLNVHHFEMNTNDATVFASDLQAGVTCYARGQKITGTGKCFSFAFYGGCNSNDIIPIPVNAINTVLISSASHTVNMSRTTLELQRLDFSLPQEVAFANVDGVNYPITIQVSSNMITITCNKVLTLEVLFGKDEYTL